MPDAGKRGKQRLCRIRTFGGSTSPAAETRDSTGKHNTCWAGKCSSNTQSHETRWPALQQAGIDRLFRLALLSYPLGVRKPAKLFYDVVLAAAGCPASEVLFVGDNFACDVAGPVAHGMRAALVRPDGLRAGEQLPGEALLIRHVRDLPPLLRTA
jgi:FMN phosphatase YigB (HAD superfamily)